MEEEIIVARKCLYCGKLFTDNRCRYCSKYCSYAYQIKKRHEVKNKLTPFSKKANKPKYKSMKSNDRHKYVYKKAKEYIKKTYKKQLHNQKVEELGTYDTAGVWNSRTKNGMRRKKDGTPDWEKEIETIEILKKKTFSNKKRMRDYSITEGDVKRGYKIEN